MHPSSESDLRTLMCEIGRRVWAREYVAANDGNFSVRLRDGRFLCTPTLVSKGFMTVDDLVVIDDRGDVVQGGRKATSEIKMHLEIYRKRPEINAIVHAHPPHAAAFAVTHENLPRFVLPEVEIWLGHVPLVPYFSPGTQEFAEALAHAAAEKDAFILANHGSVTIGRDLTEAYFRMETLEQYCKVVILAASVGRIQPLMGEQVRYLDGIREKLR